MFKKYIYLILIFLLVLCIFLFNQSSKTHENVISGDFNASSRRDVELKPRLVSRDGFAVSGTNEGFGSGITYTGGCTKRNDSYLFISSGTLTIANNATVRMLLVGGGGGGGSAARGDDGSFNSEGCGGGGGGCVGVSQIMSLSAGTYTISVGNGGAAGIIGDNRSGTAGSNGGNTSIAGPNVNETAYGGGGGGGDSLISTSGVNGGCGGGNCAGWGSYGIGNATKGSGTFFYYGKDGGVGVQNGGGGGGGGADNPGQAGNGITGGDGGNGWLISFESYMNNIFGKGGKGGNRYDNLSGESGMQNSGNGGGGGSNTTSGGSGGSGYAVVEIISMASPPSVPPPSVPPPSCTYSSTQSPCSSDVCGSSGTSTITWTQSSPSPCIGSVPAQTTQTCTVPACSPPNYTANFNVYTVVDNVPVTLQKNTRFSCVSDDCKQNNKCMDIKLGKNMAVSFQVTLNKAYSDNNRQQIFGITTDPCGTDKRVFGAWFGRRSFASQQLNQENAKRHCEKDDFGQNSIYLDTSIINPEKGNEYSTRNNIQALTDFQATISQNIRVDILCNFNQQTHEIYVNGSLTATKTFVQGPYFSSGSAYIFSSFNEFQNADGTLHDLVFLTSDIRTFKIEDLTGATTFLDTELHGKESFQNIYSPQTGGGYSSDDLRGMQTELLQEINNFNQGYSNYKKYMFNQRHNQMGDTTEKMVLYDLSGSQISDSDFAQSNIMSMYANLSESQTYNNLINDLEIFNQAIKSSATDMSYNMTTMDVNTMMAVENELVNYRLNLDEELAELNETENSMFAQNNRNMKSQTFQTILLTTLATSLVFYVFIHSE